MPVCGVGAHGGPQLGHDRRRLDTVTHDVADRDPDAAAGEREDVVPVAAEAAAGGGQVAGGRLDAEAVADLHRQQPPLQHLGDATLLVEPGVLEGEGGAVGGELEEIVLVGGEFAWGEAADVQDADDGAFDEQRDAEQGLDALLAQDRVEDVGVVDVGDGDRAALGGDAPGEAAADRDPYALFDLFLDALGGARVQRVALQHQDRHRVGREDVRHALQQLLQQLLLAEVGERGVGDQLQRLEALRGRLRRLARHALLPEEPGLLEGEGGAVGGELEEVAFVGGEFAWGEAADVQDADDGAFDEQRDAEQGLDALLAQDRVEDVGVVDVGDGDRAALGGDAPGEAAADRDPHALFDLFLDALGGARVQRVALQHQERHRVHREHLGDPLHQLVQQLLLAEERERGVGDPLQRLQHVPVAAARQRQGLEGTRPHSAMLRLPVT